MAATAGRARSGVEIVGRRPGRRRRSGYASSSLSAKSRDRDLVEEIMKAQQEFAELRKEPRSVGAELQRTKILVQKHEEALGVPEISGGGGSGRCVHQGSPWPSLSPQGVAKLARRSFARRGRGRQQQQQRLMRHVAEILATTGPAKQEDRYSNVVGLERPAPNTEFSGADGNSAFVLFLNEVALVEGDDPEQERKQREGAESNGVGAGAASKPPDDQAHDGPRLEGTGVRYGFRDRLRHGASPWKDTAEYVVEEGRLMCVNGHRGSWWAYRCPTPSMSRGQVVGMVGRSEAVNVRISSGGGGFVTRMLAHSGVGIWSIFSLIFKGGGLTVNACITVLRHVP
eukprot:g15541.t1